MNALLPPLLTLSSLRALPRFVVWRNEERNGDVTKVPYVPGTSRRAKADDPSTWGSWDDAAGGVSLIVGSLGGGIGIELGDLGDGRAIGGIDYDTCRTPDGTMESWACDLMARLGSYSEVSPSGTGAKQLFTYLADLPALLREMGTYGGKSWKRGTGKHPPSVELYLRGRYFAITEQHLPETPPDLRHVGTETLLRLIREDGPAFARAGKVATLRTIRSATADGSRSSVALSVGARARRDGATYEGMCDAIRTDSRTADWYAEKGTALSGRELRRIWDKADPATLDNVEWTEDGVAQAFTRKHADALRYDHDVGSWFEWTGYAWRQERTKRAFSWARFICREVRAKAGAEAPTSLAKAATAAAVERFAQADPALAVTAALWDSDPWLLGTPGGTVDLRTGSLRPSNREDYITRLTAVTPADVPECPLWLDFLWKTTGGDAALIRFLRQWCGYALTGDTREHALLFVFGPGGNGKTVFLATIIGILAEYTRTAAMETFTASPSDRHPTDLAMLRGARLVTASETEEGRAWAESRIKQMTGGDVIAARFMRQDFFEFRPQFKLTIIGNNKPVLRNVDDAARRRFNVVPFVRRPAEPDRQLEEKLRAEWPTILRWMIDGCVDWQRHGLTRPAVVLAATAEYFSEQDSVQQWVEECCQRGGRNISDTTVSLFKSWSDYALANGEKSGTTKWFSQTLVRLGCEQVKDTPGQRNKRGFLGISVKPMDTGGQWQNRVEAEREQHRIRRMGMNSTLVPPKGGQKMAG